jgi:hypothetical protein
MPEARRLAKAYPSLSLLVAHGEEETRRLRWPGDIPALPLSIDEIDQATDDVHVRQLVQRNWKSWAAKGLPGARRAQEYVGEDLLTVDWRRFFACKFRAALPHARDVRTNDTRNTDLYAFDTRLMH